MKKVIVFTVMALFASLAGFAQKGDGFKFSVGAELGFATGNFNVTHSIGIGATAQIEIPLQDKLYGVASGGILIYNGKAILGQGNTKYTGQNIIPVRVGAKYFLTGGVYGAAQVGLAFLSNYATGTAVSFSPQIGYEFKTNSGKAIDATLKYDAYSRSSWGAFGFRLAYIF